jgi:streptomycin 6-kinase
MLVSTPRGDTGRMTWRAGSADDYRERWGVDTVDSTFSTASSHLVLGSRAGVPVVLKVPRVEEEARASSLLDWWSGRGAAPVLEHDDHAVLLLRATGSRDLATWSESGRDDEATAVLVSTARELHRGGSGRRPPAGLVPLTVWFRELLADDRRDSDAHTRRAADVARHLLDATGPEEEVVLHGDIHHGNVLDFGDRWAAIDPKGLRGHRAFDVANIFCNPGPAAAGLFERRLALVGEITSLERPHLAAWIVAWCALTRVWEERNGADTWHTRLARDIGMRALPMANLL